MAEMKMVLVSEHRIMREGLRSCLERLKSVAVVGEAEGGRAAIAAVRRTQPDIVVLDASAGNPAVADVTNQIVRCVPGTKVIVLSGHAHPRYVAEMIEAGAAGFLKKECGFNDLAVALRAVIKGRTYLGPGVKRLKSPARPARNSRGMQLARREVQVLQLMAGGKCTKEVALALGLSAKTVETYRKRIMDKLDVHNVAQLTHYAIREGLTPLDD
jgi:DNA-binding NarL/FixJ family response regulator